MKENVVLGIDIGGTNIAFGLVNKEGEISEKGSIPTKNIKDVSELPLEIKNNFNFSSKTIIGIGIGAPSSNFYTGCIENAPNLNWGLNIPLASMFEKVFNVKTLLTNDANAAALGEKQFGVAKGLSDFVMVTLGTGVGSGVVVNNELVYGKNGTAGEYGHIMIEKDGRQCGCGRKGCLETYCSSSGLVNSFKLLDHNEKVNSILNDTKEVSAKLILDSAEDGDVFATYLVDFTAEKLGYSLANFAAFSNPEAYIIFGGLAQNGAFFRKKVNYHLQQNLLNLYAGKVNLLTSTLHDRNAAILGASALIFNS